MHACRSTLEDPTDPPGHVIVFTADGAYFHIEHSDGVGDPRVGFERGYYSYDGGMLGITTLFDTNGTTGLSDSNGTFFGPLTVVGDTLMAGGPVLGHRIAGSPGSIIAAWLGGSATELHNTVLLVPTGTDYFALFDFPDQYDAEIGTYTWDPVTHELTAFVPGQPPDPGNFVTLAANGLGIHLLGDDGEEFDLTRVIDPATIPVIANTPLSASGIAGQPLVFGVSSTNAASFSAVGLPGALSIDANTGVITGLLGAAGQFTSTVFATNAAGVSDIETLTLTIAGVTPPGSDVVFEPELPAGAPAMSMTFDEVTSAGATTVSVIDPGATPLPAPPPGGFTLAGLVYFEIETTATFTGPVTLCFSYAGVDFGGRTPRLLHFESGRWVNITTSLVTATQTICGTTSSLSPFGLFASSDPTSLTSVGDARAWIGLKNSDDQGTRFDLLAELYKGDALITSGVVRCISGVTRNANGALAVAVPLDPLTPSESVPLATGDALTLRFSTRIGTTATGARCGGHGNAAGLRLYYDGANRPTGIDARILPAADSSTFFARWTKATGGVLDDEAPTGPATFKDSAPVTFSRGNVWKTVGEWTMTIPVDGTSVPNLTELEKLWRRLRLIAPRDPHPRRHVIHWPHLFFRR